MVCASRHPAFTLVELLIVVIILGILATVVIPQFTNAGEEARSAALQTNLAIMRGAINRYVLEHYGRSPDKDENGNDDSDNAVARLTGRTQPDGKLDVNGPRGPYLASIPVNPYNGKTDIRLDGAAAGVNTAGWQVDTVTGKLSADDSLTHAAK